jgi:hypothetical protein
MAKRKTSGNRHPAFPPKLGSPPEIQAYLNRIPYDDVPGTRSPYWVTVEKRANCFEGALFAAAMLRLLGHPPLIVDLRAENDDDHILAVFRHNGLWGAVAKSNTTTLRYRDPVYRNLRELVMSYFEGYINTLGDKTLRSYSRPLHLGRYDRRNWATTGEDLSDIGEDLDRMTHTPLLSRKGIRALTPADRDLYKAVFLGSLKSGLYKAERRDKKGSTSPRARRPRSG